MNELSTGTIMSGYIAPHPRDDQWRKTKRNSVRGCFAPPIQLLASQNIPTRVLKATMAETTMMAFGAASAPRIVS